METSTISKKLLQRLPVYLSYLKSLPEDLEHVSATVIARELGFGEVQVRKDLAKISQTGRSRVGRSRQHLIRDIETFLDFSAKSGTIVVGAGKLGQALLDYRGFEDSGLNLMAGFDISPQEKQTPGGKPIYSLSRLESFCRYYDVRIGIIAVPADSAQEVCNGLIGNGITAIWNFAPVQLTVPEHVILQNENLALSLSTLCLNLQANQQSL